MTTTDIFDRALAEIGHDRTIDDAGGTDSVEYKRCNLVFDSARKAILSSADWNWLAEETPILHGSRVHACPSPDAPFVFPFQNPGLRLIGVFTPERKRVERCSITSTSVYASCPAVFFRYVPDNTEYDTWPSILIDALVYELAGRIALPMGAGAETMAALRKQADFSVQTAKQRDASETNSSGAGNRYVNSRR